MNLCKKNLKKNLQEEIIKNPNHKLFYFDESRFGTHSRLGRGWFKKGSRTLIKKKLGFKNFYTYTAASPKEGREFSLMMPYVNTTCMNMFLEYMSKMLDNETALLVTDQAGRHKSKDLLIPNNIKIIYLPPYSPELNPVEKLWQYMKDNILKNKVYKSLEILEQEVSGFINNLTCDVIKSVCNVNYLSSYL